MKIRVYFEKTGYIDIDGVESVIEGEEKAMSQLYREGLDNENDWEMVDETKVLGTEP